MGSAVSESSSGGVSGGEGGRFGLSYSIPGGGLRACNLTERNPFVLRSRTLLCSRQPRGGDGDFQTCQTVEPLFRSRLCSIWQRDDDFLARFGAAVFA